jgi:uncharacterized phage-associated protein
MWREREMSKYTCQDIANYFIFLGNSTGSYISNLKLQKLVYYAQAWHLALFGKSLFDEDFQAWVHGPVEPALWRKYTEFGFNPILKKVKAPELDAHTDRFLTQVSEVYFRLDAFELELMTHKEDPWIRARKGYAPDERCATVISKEAMKDYYAKRLAKTQA